MRKDQIEENNESQQLSQLSTHLEKERKIEEMKKKIYQEEKPEVEQVECEEIRYGIYS